MSKLAEAVVISGWVLVMLCCFAVIGADIHHAFWTPEKPPNKELSDMARIAFGFVVGSLPLMIKDLLLQKATPPK